MYEIHRISKPDLLGNTLFVVSNQLVLQAGRSTYVSAEILAMVPDPGAMAAASWYLAAALAVKGHS